MNEAAARKTLLDLMTPMNMFIGLGVISLVIMLMGTCSMIGVDGPLPPPRDPPPPIERAVVYSYRYKEGFYKSLINEDAGKLGIKGEIQVEQMRKGNLHAAEFSGNQRLKVGAKLETQHLVIQALQKKIFVGEAGQGYRTDHLLLKITNKSAYHLAYRVITKTYGHCGAKGPMTHNAIAIAPGESTTRTECLSRGSKGIRVKKVEVLRLTPLGYHYVSRLDPAQLAYSRRTSAGHEHKPMAACKMLPWSQIQNAFKRAEAKWYDVIDYYSRHNCDDYSFHVGYVWNAKGPKRLPVVPPKK
jgi:hypothetical protein